MKFAISVDHAMIIFLIHVSRTQETEKQWCNTTGNHEIFTQILKKYCWEGKDYLVMLRMPLY